MSEIFENRADSLERRIQRAHLTKGQRQIADYVLKNQNRVRGMTSLASRGRLTSATFPSSGFPGPSATMASPS